MHTSNDEKTKVLLMSDAGTTLRDFGDLGPTERRLLLTRLVRLHQAGVLHNDLEPRNVARSKKSGPLIIDFDEASLNHVCPGPSCWELRRLAHLLQLDATVEIAELLPVARACPMYVTFAVLILTLWSVYHLIYL
ncbi:hypothetical protein DFH06DRAFT_1174618 [Mycena polygramma]|nr:hypothetical protein DFH06DRAFT_1254732 [Mycena polygramma]KAJ7673142.1 hypothetical protein DFH06DRAFT_1174618 [Mycena polygramma]